MSRDRQVLQEECHSGQPLVIPFHSARAWAAGPGLIQPLLHGTHGGRARGITEYDHLAVGQTVLPEPRWLRKRVDPLSAIGALSFA